jgi:hypothetical protein
MSNLTFYAIYLAISLSITIWVGRTLRSSGRKFLLRALDGPDMADTVNQLLQIGFYLANVGYIALVFRNYDQLQTAQQVLEAALPKLGGVLLILGLVHLFNMLVLSRLGAARLQRQPLDEPPSPSARAAVHASAKILEEAYHLRS